MKAIYNEVTEIRELNAFIVFDYLDWKLAMGQTPKQAHLGLKETLEAAKADKACLPPKATYGWYNLGRRVAHKAIAARSTAMRLLKITYKNSYWYVRSAKVTALLNKLNKNPTVHGIAELLKLPSPTLVPTKRGRK